jgi:hypothetical protein
VVTSNLVSKTNDFIYRPFDCVIIIRYANSTSKSSSPHEKSVVIWVVIIVCFDNLCFELVLNKSESVNLVLDQFVD